MPADAQRRQGHGGRRKRDHPRAGSDSLRQGPGGGGIALLPDSRLLISNKTHAVLQFILGTQDEADGVSTGRAAVSAKLIRNPPAARDRVRRSATCNELTERKNAPEPCGDRGRARRRRWRSKIEQGPHHQVGRVVRGASEQDPMATPTSPRAEPRPGADDQLRARSAEARAEGRRTRRPLNRLQPFDQLGQAASLMTIAVGARTHQDVVELGRVRSSR